MRKTIQMQMQMQMHSILIKCKCKCKCAAFESNANANAFESNANANANANDIMKHTPVAMVLQMIGIMLMLMANQINFAVIEANSLR